MDLTTNESALNVPRPQVITSGEGKYKKLGLVIIVILLVLSVLVGGGYYISKNYSYLFTGKQVAAVYEDTNKLPEDFNKKGQDGPYSCPLPKQYCANKNYFKDAGLNVDASRSANVVAAFDGHLDIFTRFSEASESANYHEVVLFNKDRGLRAYYYYYGDVEEGISEVKEGDKIGITARTSEKTHSGVSFTFELMKISSGFNTGNLVNFKPEDFR